LILASLVVVDHVVLFDDETPLELIKFVKPNVLVKGGDYAAEEVVGSDEVINDGGKVEIIQYIKGYSTSELIKKIRE